MRRVIHSMELIFKSGFAGTFDHQILVADVMMYHVILLPTHTGPSLDELTVLRVEFADRCMVQT